MADKKQNIGKKAGKAKSGSFMKEVLSGTMVTEKIILKNLWYVLLITLLIAIYIGNRFHAEKITRELSKVQREVRDLRSESLSTSADLMNLSRQSEVYRLIKERGLILEELKTPPYKVIVDKK
jgi:hypothetical protein